MCLQVLYNADARIVKFHPLPLALNNGVVVAEVKPLALMDHEAFESVPLGLHVCLAHELFWKRDPIIQFLLLVCLRVNPEPLEVDEE